MEFNYASQRLAVEGGVHILRSSSNARMLDSSATRQELRACKLVRTPLEKILECENIYAALALKIYAQRRDATDYPPTVTVDATLTSDGNIFIKTSKDFFDSLINSRRSGFKFMNNSECFTLHSQRHPRTPAAVCLKLQIPQQTHSHNIPRRC